MRVRVTMRMPLFCRKAFTMFSPTYTVSMVVFGASASAMARV